MRLLLGIFTVTVTLWGQGGYTPPPSTGGGGGGISGSGTTGQLAGFTGSTAIGSGSPFVTPLAIGIGFPSTGQLSIAPCSSALLCVAGDGQSGNAAAGLSMFGSVGSLQRLEGGIINLFSANGTLAVPTNSSNNDKMGAIIGSFYHGGWQTPDMMDLVVTDVTQTTTACCQVNVNSALNVTGNVTIGTTVLNATTGYTVGSPFAGVTLSSLTGLASWVAGVPSIATITQLAALFTGCTSSTTNLFNAAGTCTVVTNPTFANIGAGTNTNALLVGAGGSLGFTSTGTINASSVGLSLACASCGTSSEALTITGQSSSDVPLTLLGANTSGLLFVGASNASQVRYTPTAITFDYNGGVRDTIAGQGGSGGDIGITANSNNGNIILTPNGSGVLELVGPVTALLAATATGDISACFNATSKAVTEGSVCGTSLAIYKTNIVTMSNGLDYIKQMNPVTFSWKQDGKSDIGFIADQMAAIDPRLGAYDASGVLFNMRDRPVLATAVKAIQELSDEVATLKARLAALEAR